MLTHSVAKVQRGSRRNRQYRKPDRGTPQLAVPEVVLELLWINEGV